MKYEVEQKFRVEDVTSLVQRFAEIKAERGATQKQIDRYFNHPSRDFAQTDEALRIRCEEETSFFTYKGPKAASETKTRVEINLPILTTDIDATLAADFLLALGFREVASVRKTREYYLLDRSGFAIEAAIDTVQNLGVFAEIEICVDDERLASAQAAVMQLACELNLTQLEKRSYLELVLESPSHRRVNFQ